MGKISYLRLKGSQNLRLRLLLSTLSSTPILIEDIRADATWPGMLSHEVSLLRLLEKVSDDCHVEINETGTKLKYKPGIVMGGRNLVHDCGVSRSIGYFLEPLIVLGLFGKKPLTIRLKGITNDSKDPSVDTFKSATLPMLKRFGVPPEGLELKIESRGVPPHGGGEIILSIPVVQDSLKAISWIDEGMVKRIRGISFSTRVSVRFERSIIDAARGILNRLLPDVYIFTDHRAGPQAGKSPGYGITLVAETTSGCFMSSDTAISNALVKEDDVIEDEENKEFSPPEDVGEQIASMLLGEIEQGGVVDSTHQGLLFILCALCSQDVSKVRVGQLTPYGIEVLRHIRDFLGVKFVIKPDPSTRTVILKCVGCGLKNLSRKVS
ncbi:probable RNA 3'-terminal phosphate cyclase-like protein [Olea europaea var. sylvestris]|uniref:Probable RNA 3 -terminal phosphate cyclase n=1 Tax=Olea europaea subsp. europaea TaxID=158383 RepID=A0A8S0QRE9_OLEEU|nr:probable RNA 3'-terminal phosphate cyclase-like protein [Olea europaea var. sylvestris]CAA2967049.1 probable RNA 3 -terminal phosphate cyclase [Olea europaea subsp. europaea]